MEENRDRKAGRRFRILTMNVSRKDSRSRRSSPFRTFLDTATDYTPRGYNRQGAL